MATKKKSTKTTATKSAIKQSPQKNKSTKSKQVKSSLAAIGTKLNGNSLKNSIPTSIKVNKLYVIGAIVIVLLILIAFQFKSVFVAAIVNGQPISRLELVSESEKQAGRQTLENLIRNTLIEQEGEKKGIKVTEQEIDEEIKKVEETLKKQGQEIESVLDAQGLSRADLRRLIRLDKLVAKIVGKDIKISDKEINEYIENNREVLPSDQTDAELKKTVSENLKQQKLNEEVQKWLTELKAKANIQYIVDY